MSNQSTITPSADEVAVINKIINVFSNERMSYKQAITILPHIEKALKEIALNDLVKS